MAPSLQMRYSAPMRIYLVTTAMILTLGASACDQGQAPSKPTASSTAKASAAPRQTSSTTASAEKKADDEAAPPTDNLTPALLKKHGLKLMGKKVKGEGLMYQYESGKLNGEMTYSAYIADDEQKTNSFQCSLKGDPKIKDKTMVTFQGTVKNPRWLEDCEIAEKK